MSTIAKFLARPGVQTSEFKVLVAITAWLGINADQHFVSLVQGVIISAPGIVYALARGMAKYDTTTKVQP